MVTVQAPSIRLGRRAGRENWLRRWRRWSSAGRLLLAYTSSFLWHERPRFLSAVLAVTFSAALISLQAGLVLGIYAATSLPIDPPGAHGCVISPPVPRSAPRPTFSP